MILSQSVSGGMRIATLAFLPTLLLTATPALADGKVQPWPTLTVTVPVAPGVLVMGEVLGRIGADRPSQVEERIGVGHPLTRRLTLWMAYAGITTDPRGPDRNGREDQIVGQANWSAIPAGPIRLAARTRIEHRALRGDDGISWRLREQLRATAPLGIGRPSLVLWAEPFVALNRTARVRRTLDQLRLFAGISVPVDRRVDLETGFLRQTFFRVTGNVNNDAIPLMVTLHF